MLPSISNLLNPPESPRSNYQYDRTHQLPTLLPPLPHSTRALSSANPMLATPVHRQPLLCGPGEIRNPILSTPSVHAQRTVHPIAHCTGQPIAPDHNKFPVTFKYQMADAENQEYPVQYIHNSKGAVQGTFKYLSSNTCAAAMVSGSTKLNSVSNPLSGNGDHFTIPSTISASADINRNAAIIRAQSGVHSVSAHPELNAPRMLTPQLRKKQSGVSNGHLPPGIQYSREQSQSLHQTRHSSYNDTEKPSFKSSAHPHSGNSSPATFNTPQVQFQTGVLSSIPFRASSGERLFPSMEELEGRKLHFMQNAYPPTDPILLPKKRSLPHAFLSHEQNEEENTGLASNSDKELHCKRIKITKTSRLATQLYTNASNRSPVDQEDSSRAYENFPSTGKQTHLLPLGFPSRSHGYRKGQRTPRDSRNSPPPPDSFGNESHHRSYHNSPDQGLVAAEGFQYSSRADLKGPRCGVSNTTGAAIKSDYGRGCNQPSGQEDLNASQTVASSTKRHTNQKKKYTSVPLSTGGKHFNNLAPVQSSRKETCSDESRPNQAPTEANHAVDEHITGGGIVRNTYRCDECNATFANEDSITRHKRVQHIFATHPSEMVTCPECALLLRNKQNLKRHLATHGPNAKHKCLECDAKFVTERARTTHMRDVHGQKAEQRSVKDISTTCPVTGCSYASNQKTNVKRHYENKHLNIKRFHCTHPTCDYIGSTRANRQAHMKTHEKRNLNLYRK